MTDRMLDAAWRAIVGAVPVVIAVAAAFALGGSRPAAWVAVGAVVAAFAANLALSVAKYRRTMRRPWPKVEPLSDDDWA
jgi:O-antigen/teichoic acid export membrane protein